MQDQIAQTRKGYLEEQFVRGAAAARSQITSHNSGKSDQAPTKVGRPTTMEADRVSMAEYEKRDPKMVNEIRKNREDRAKLANSVDGAEEKPRSVVHKEIVQDENSRLWQDSPRNKVG